METVAIERREVIMQKRGPRIRAVIRMGLTWGTAWGAGGLVLARVPGFYSDLPFALFFAPLGFAAGIIFSGILVAIEGRRGFGHPSLALSVAWGAASGLLLSGIFVVGAAIRGADWWREFLVFGPPLATASAVCAVGSWLFARRAKRAGLADGAGDPAEVDASEAKRRERQR